MGAMISQGPSLSPIESGILPTQLSLHDHEISCFRVRATRTKLGLGEKGKKSSGKWPDKERYPHLTAEAVLAILGRVWRDANVPNTSTRTDRATDDIRQVIPIAGKDKMRFLRRPPGKILPSCRGPFHQPGSSLWNRGSERS
jgi:hypothetical protein